MIELLCVLLGACLGLFLGCRSRKPQVENKPTYFTASFFGGAIAIDLHPEKYGERLGVLHCFLRLAHQPGRARA